MGSPGLSARPGSDDEEVDDAAVYAAVAPRLLRLAATLVGPSAAEDVMASAVTRVIASPAWPSVTDRQAYLVRAVVNEARSSHRSAMRREVRERKAARPVEDAGPEPAFDALRAVAALPLRQRAVVYLTYWEDLAPFEVARTLGIAEGSVRQHLARARRTLRRTLS